MASTKATDSRAEFDDLFHRTRKRALSQASRLQSNATEAEELVQEAYCRAWCHFSKYDRSRRFDAWLATIISHLFIDNLRRRKKTEIISLETRINDSGVTLGELCEAPNADPEKIMLGHILNEKLQAALDDLPKDFLKTLLLFEAGLSYREIADLTKVEEGTVRSRLHRARAMIIQRVKR